MTQRDLVKVATGVVIGAAIVVAVGMAFGWNPFSGDKKTEVTWSPVGPSGACVLGKSTHVRVGKGRQLSWEIKNYCTDGAKIVSVGNFRRSGTAATTDDCADAGADFPFSDPTTLATRTSTLEAAEAESNGEVDPTEGRIKLKVKGRPDLGDTELVYQFDICLDGRKVDPMLVVER